jgi:hypothetical protein
MVTLSSAQRFVCSNVGCPSQGCQPISITMPVHVPPPLFPPKVICPHAARRTVACKCRASHARLTFRPLHASTGATATVQEMYGYSYAAAQANVWHKWDHHSMLYPSYVPGGRLLRRRFTLFCKCFNAVDGCCQLLVQSMAWHGYDHPSHHTWRAHAPKHQHVRDLCDLLHGLHGKIPRPFCLLVTTCLLSRPPTQASPS